MITHATYVPAVDLPGEVRAALSTYLRVDPADVVIPDNAHKYAENDADTAGSAALKKIFQIMWELNRQGLSSDSLGNTRWVRRPLREALRAILGHALDAMGSDPYQYTELGPEPAKTTHIITYLIRHGADLRRYTAIDINPYSRSPVTEQVSQVLPNRPVRYREQVFANVTAGNCRCRGMHNLVTMLGFEEGNEHPATNASMLGSMLDPGDLLLSEMQLLPKTSWLPIFEFYSTDLMRRFSHVGSCSVTTAPPHRTTGSIWSRSR